MAWFRGWVFGEWAVCQGWAGQASVLLAQAGDARADGWLRYEQARHGTDLDAQRRLYLEAIDLGRSTGDADLECDATASLGMMLVFSGLVDEGMAHLDRALAAICGGGVRELPVIEGCLCGLLNACERTHDVDRAEQWLQAAQEVIRSDRAPSPWRSTITTAAPAGSYRYLHRCGGEEYGFHGCSHDVRPSELIVQTFTYEGEPDGVALERLVLEDLGDGRTQLVATSLVDSFEGRDAFVASGMETGVREGYERLDEVLGR